MQCWNYLYRLQMGMDGSAMLGVAPPPLRSRRWMLRGSAKLFAAA